MVNRTFHYPSVCEYVTCFLGPSSWQVNLLGESVSVPGGESEVAESLHFCAKQLHHQSLRQQNSEWVWYLVRPLTGSLVCKPLRVCCFSKAHERGLHPKLTINCAGYRALTSMEEYMELLNTSLPGGSNTRKLLSHIVNVTNMVDKFI